MNTSRIHTARQIVRIIKRIYSYPQIRKFINSRALGFINRYKYIFIAIFMTLILLLCCCCILFVQLSIGSIGFLNNINQLIQTDRILNLPNILSNQNQQNKDYYKVVSVIDGDTFVVLDSNGKNIKVRMIGIDTPELNLEYIGPECYAIEAFNIANEYLQDKWVILRPDETQGDKDKYGRLLRYVFIPKVQDANYFGINIPSAKSEEIFFNLYLLEEGYAYEYTYNQDKPYKYQKDFKEAQTKAMKNNKGLWNPNNCKE